MGTLHGAPHERAVLSLTHMFAQRLPMVPVAHAKKDLADAHGDATRPTTSSLPIYPGTEYRLRLPLHMP